MKSIYLVRHAETEWNLLKKFQGHKDSPLTSNGIEQCKKLKKRLENVKFDKIISSPLERAKKTTELIMEDKKYDLILDNRIMELNLGPWEGVDDVILKQKYGQQYYNFWNKCEDFEVKGIETFKNLNKRTHEFINEILSESFSNILIVCHGITLKSIFMIWDKRNISNFWQEPFMKSACLNIVEIDNNNSYTINTLADVSHL